jgi:hypothetical protein
MKMYKGLRGILAALGLFLLATAAHAEPRLAITPLGLQITQLQEVPGNPRAIDVTARTGVINRGDPATAVRATLVSSSPKFVVLDGELFFGDVPRTALLRPVISQDTFKLRITLPKSRTPLALLALLQEINQSLDWNVTCANCGNANLPPISDAGADQTVYVAQLVTLDGSASSDPDGQSLRYTWSFVSRPAGSNASLSATSVVRPTFTPDREGDYVVQLVVNDGIVNSAPDAVRISTQNSAPVADAGFDRQTQVGVAVVLDGTASSDIDGDMLTYAWSVVTRPAGSVVQIVDPAHALANFTPDVAGQYVIELVVDDGTVSSAPDSIVISTTQQNSAPAANAGVDQSAHVGDVVQLDGSGSTDSDADPLTYAWALNARPANSTATLQGADTATPALNIDKPGTYVAQLIVSDGKAASTPDTVSISTENSAPVASIAAPATVKWGSSVTLDGTASSDRDGDGLGFNWSMLSRPDGSEALLDDANGTTSGFTADQPGVYVTQLVVNDGQTNSEPASATITATNNAPVANDDSAVTAQGVAIDIAVLANDSDADADALSISSVTQPAHGAASINGTSLRYVPATGYVGDDAFGYTATDGADSDTATVSLSVTAGVPANRPPTAQAGQDRTVTAGSLVSLDGSQSSDPDGDPLSYQWVLQTQPAGSAATLSGASTAAPQFTADRRGLYTLSLTVQDSRGGSATDSVDVTALNRDPVAGPDSASTTMDQAITIDVLANDTDADGDVLTIASITQPANGTTAIDGTSVAFTPAAGFSGTTAFNYAIGDGNGGTASAAVSVSVTQPLSALSIDDLSITEGDTGTTTVAFTLSQSAPSANATSVSYTTADGSAIAGADYVASSGIAQIAPGSTSTEVVVTINGDTLAEANESLFVRLANPVNATIADGEGIAEIVNDDGGAPTTFELIGDALADGVIDEETALVYSVFAEFQDPRLPAQYVGRDEPFFEGLAIRTAARRFSTLSPATQAVVAPFLEFPDLFAAPEGAGPQLNAAPTARAGERVRFMPLAPNATYRTIDLVPGVVTIGWDENSPLAAALEEQALVLKAEFDARIWPKLSVFLGVPTSGKILILLEDSPGVSRETVTADCTVARIWLHQFDPWVFAHELTHALIDLNFSIAACNDGEKLWMHEATATWAQHYVYPPANQGREQLAATYFLRSPERSLSAYDGDRHAVRNGHEYGAYLWFLRLAGQGSNPGIVRAMWEAGAGVSSIEAIESVLQSSGLGGFKEQWPKFALDNWNRQPPYRKYHDWDRLDHKANQADFAVTLDGESWKTIPLTYELPKLSATYQRLDFSDPGVRGILFRIDAGNSEDASIQAIVKIKDQPWQDAENWSATPDAKFERFFCRDDLDEDVEEIILVVANRGFGANDPPIRDEGRFNLYYSALTCADFTGTTTYRKEQRPLPDAESVTSAMGTGLRFRVDLTHPGGGIWRAVEGSVSVRQDDVSPFEDGSCTGRASTTFDAATHAQVFIFPQGTELVYLGTDLAFLPTPPTIVQHISCSSSSGTFEITQTVPYFGTPWFFTGPVPLPFAVGATSIAGSNPAQPAEERWTWDLQKEE